MGSPCPPLPWHPTSTGHPSCRDTLHPPAPADPQASCAHQDLVRLLEGRHPLQQLPGDVLAGCPVGAGARARARDRDRGRGRGRQQQQQQRREAEAEVETVERGHGRSVPPPAPAPGSYGVAAGGESPGQVAPAPRYCEIAASLESRTDTGPGSPGCAPPRPAPRPAGTGRDGQENPGQFLAAPRPGPPRRQRHGPDRDPRARPGTPPPGAPGPPCRGHRAARAGRESPETGVVVVPSVSPRRPLRVPSVCVPRCVAQCPPSPLTPPPAVSLGGTGKSAGAAPARQPAAPRGRGVPAGIPPAVPPAIPGTPTDPGSPGPRRAVLPAAPQSRRPRRGGSGASRSRPAGLPPAFPGPAGAHPLRGARGDGPPVPPLPARGAVSPVGLGWGRQGGGPGAGRGGVGAGGAQHHGPAAVRCPGDPAEPRGTRVERVGLQGRACDIVGHLGTLWDPAGWGGRGMLLNTIRSPWKPVGHAGIPRGARGGCGTPVGSAGRRGRPGDGARQQVAGSAQGSVRCWGGTEGT